MSTGNLVLLEQCYDATHAHILRGMLESNDIYCILAGDNHNQTDPFLSIALGGIRVMVREEDLPIAKSLINATEEEDAPAKPKEFLQKPYWRSILLGIAGFVAGMPMMRAKGKNQS